MKIGLRVKWGRVCVCVCAQWKWESWKCWLWLGEVVGAFDGRRVRAPNFGNLTDTTQTEECQWRARSFFTFFIFMFLSSSAEVGHQRFFTQVSRIIQFLSGIMVPRQSERNLWKSKKTKLQWKRHFRMLSHQIGSFSTRVLSEWVKQQFYCRTSFDKFFTICNWKIASCSRKFWIWNRKCVLPWC